MAQTPSSGLVRIVISHPALRYLLVGGFCFLVDFALLALLKAVLGWPVWIATGVAFLVSFVVTYTLQRLVAFSADTPHGRALVRYAILVAINTVASSLIVAGLDTLLDSAGFTQGWAIGKIVATAITTVWNYFAYRYWVFRSPTKGQS
ncbi:GtrA family protein [Schumannella sp. 10F1B-5-1]|uniref:GtrA family protein n=1 Tax=Schumannella sp. 10F1B-5-1 TaxID=2590780 RepID=UPI0015E85EE1|nr:GtrA family protein [Schumannella sp. 10F1B-5-1]